MTATEAPPRTSIRLIGRPWELQHVQGGPDFPAITPLATWGTLSLDNCGLTPHQGRMLAAIHEAGHALLLHRAGFEIDGIEIYPDDPQAPEPGQRPGDGHTLVGALRPGARPTPGAVIAALLAGQVAAEAWLEQEGLANDRSRLLTYSTAASDHERLLTVGAGAAFLYGDAKPPRDWPGLVFRIDRLASIARYDLGESWEAVSMVARLADERGTVDAGQLAGMLGEGRGTR